MPLWGKNYINRFQEYILPSLNSQGNLPFLKKKKLTITICSEKKSLIEIKELFYKYQNEVKFNTFEIDKILKKEKKRRILHKIYFEGIKLNKNDHRNTYFIFLNSDDFFSENYFKNLQTILKKYDCILENKLLVNEKLFKKNILRYRRKDKSFNINSYTLFDLALKSLDDFSKYSFLNINKFFNYKTYVLYWKINKHFILSSGLLLHPIIIKPKKKITKMNGFLDYYLIPEYANLRKTKIIENNQKLFRVGISNDDVYGYHISKNLDKISSAFSAWSTDFHRTCMDTITFFISSEKKFNKKEYEYNKKMFFNEINLIKKKLKRPKSFKKHPYWGSKKIHKENILKTLIKFAINKICNKKIYYIHD